MGKKGWKRWMILCGILLALSGCATTGDIQLLDKDIHKLELQISQLQREKESIRKDMDSLRTELNAFKKETETNLAFLQSEHSKTRADLTLRLENLQSETKALSTGVEEYKGFLKAPSQEISRVREDVEVRLRILEEKGRAIDEKNRSFEEKQYALEERNRFYEERLKGLEDRFKGLDAKLTAKVTDLEKMIPPKEAIAEPKPSSPSTAAGNLYKDAFETLQRGDLEGGRRKFEAFLKQYPNMELSDNAQFWIGETHFLRKEYERAILEYEKVIVKYPEGDKVPAAMLKQGLAFLELGDQTNGKNLLRRVMERYPQTEQADIAKKKLETLK